jgi:hypothetical protein
MELDLSVNPDKTRLFGMTLCHSMLVKYLGAVLDSWLTWKEHVDVKARKVHNLLWACRRAYTVTWGLRPRVAQGLYVSIIKPSITFASLAWWPHWQTASAKKKLSRDQRLRLGITKAMCTASTNAVEALIYPPKLVVHSKARSAVHCLWSLGSWSYLHPNQGRSSFSGSSSSY